MKLDWDHYSDQPAVIRDRAIKKSISKTVRFDSFKMLLCNLVMYPVCFLNYLLFPVKKIETNLGSFFGMSINLDKEAASTPELVDDLGANNLLIRIPLSDIENIRAYVDFIKQYQDKSILINILQDRRHVEDHGLLKQSLTIVFSELSPFTNRFQLGNAVNRKKWAIFSMDQFLKFYKVGYDLRNENFPNLTLLGSSVIDFEYYFSIRTLFNGYRVKFDQFSSLLYVDRRGAPENTQMGLDLVKKLRLMQAMLRLSSKSSNQIVITETNWPITNTAPYAPTSEADCVSLDAQADFLVRYYLLALSSGAVKNIYWHQLIAPGYGLIDNRSDELVKYPSYYAFKVMLAQLQDMQFVGATEIDGLYTLKFRKQVDAGLQQITNVMWLHSDDNKQIPHNLDKTVQQVMSRDGTSLNFDDIQISGSPIYLISTQDS